MFLQVGIDLIGPLPQTDAGNRYIGILIDGFTKWPEFQAQMANMLKKNFFYIQKKLEV